MKKIPRRSFLKATALTPLMLHSTFRSRNRLKAPLLSFSTLGCPDWPFPKIVDFAAAHQYNGIEFRGILRQLDLTQCPEFSTPEKIRESRKIIEDKGLRVVDLGSSATLHFTDPAQRQKNLMQGKQFIDLAMQLNCPHVRVFPNNLPKDDTRQKIIDLIIQGLTELGDYAKKGNVTVLLESHGDAVKTEELKQIMEATSHTQTGLLWDVVNMWEITREPPVQVYRQLKPYIQHTHLKDCVFRDGKIHYVPFGTGVAPVWEAVDALSKGGYKGYYSFEWEKLWHPDIGDPETALADFPVMMRKHFRL